MNRPEDQVLVIFGASGDLTKRMLMPSLYELHVRQMLPERFVILGTSRKSMSDEEFRLSIRLMLEELKGEKGLNGEEVNRFLQKVYYQPFDPVEGADELGERVMFLMEEYAIPMRVVYYLATPPNSQQAITKYIGRSCLFGVKERGGWHRIVVEKPFGTSLETAKELDKSLLQVFCEQEIYRIDHFLYWSYVLRTKYSNPCGIGTTWITWKYMPWNRSGSRIGGSITRQRGLYGIWCRTI